MHARSIPEGSSLEYACPAALKPIVVVPPLSHSIRPQLYVKTLNEYTPSVINTAWKVFSYNKHTSMTHIM